MKDEENKKKIQNLLEQYLKKDRTKTQIEGFTKLDLLEMTRKHVCVPMGTVLKGHFCPIWDRCYYKGE